MLVQSTDWEYSAIENVVLKQVRALQRTTNNNHIGVCQPGHNKLRLLYKRQNITFGSS